MSTTHTTPSATGRKGERDGTAYVVFERTFEAPIADVWGAVTESDRLSRWIGNWSGDPKSGSISFFMTAEAEDAPAETIWIDECVEPTRLVMRSARPDDHSEVWSWQIDLAESVGPGWDYYLDRMVAAETGGDLAAIDFNDYYPAFAAYYRDELS